MPIERRASGAVNFFDHGRRLRRNKVGRRVVKRRGAAGDGERSAEGEAHSQPDALSQTVSKSSAL